VSAASKPSPGFSGRKSRRSSLARSHTTQQRDVDAARAHASRPDDGRLHTRDRDPSKGAAPLWCFAYQRDGHLEFDHAGAGGIGCRAVLTKSPGVMLNSRPGCRSQRRICLEWQDSPWPALALAADHCRRFREPGGFPSRVHTVPGARLTAHATDLPPGLLLQPLGLSLQFLVGAENDIALEDRPAVDDGVLYRARLKKLALDQRCTDLFADDLLTPEISLLVHRAGGEISVTIRHFRAWLLVAQLRLLLQGDYYASGASRYVCPVADAAPGIPPTQAESPTRLRCELRPWCLRDGDGS
jgi:hypothetical protein